jgi:RimJ/RimL family protein N-acetyltransferase
MIIRVPTEPITDETVVLDAAEDRWRPAFELALTDPGFLEFSYFNPSGPTTELERQLCTYRANVGHGRVVAFGLFPANSGETAGFLDLALPPATGKIAEPSYWIAPSHRRRGFATRGLRLVSDWALTTTDVEEITISIHPDHRVSHAVARKAGFVHRGQFHQAQPVGGSTLVDLYVRTRGDRMLT